MPMKKRYYWLIGILLVLIVTNPTMNDFKDFVGYDNGSHMLNKIHNYFICSTYWDNATHYLGVFGNFFEI